MATTGHEDEKISVGGLKASLQKFKNDKVDPIVSNHATTGTTGDYPYNGKGLVTLPKNMVSGVNTLTQAMMPTATGGNTVYVIRYDYDLAGQTITVPAGCTLKFEGGTLSNGTLAIGRATTVIGNGATIYCPVVLNADGYRDRGALVQDITIDCLFQYDDAFTTTNVNYAVINNLRVRNFKRYGIYVGSDTFEAQFNNFECLSYELYENLERPENLCNCGLCVAATDNHFFNGLIKHCWCGFYLINSDSVLENIHVWGSGGVTRVAGIVSSGNKLNNIYCDAPGANDKAVGHLVLADDDIPYSYNGPLGLIFTSSGNVVSNVNLTTRNVDNYGDTYLFTTIGNAWGNVINNVVVPDQFSGDRVILYNGGNTKYKQDNYLKISNINTKYGTFDRWSFFSDYPERYHYVSGNYLVVNDILDAKNMSYTNIYSRERLVKSGSNLDILLKEVKSDSIVFDYKSLNGTALPQIKLNTNGLSVGGNSVAVTKSVTLPKNMVNGVNTLTSDMVSLANTTYVILYDYDLGGATVTIPAGCTLKFDGGTLSNGTLTGQDTTIEAGPVKIFNDNLTLAGTWNVKDGCVEWFGCYAGDSTKDTTPAIKKLVAVAIPIRFGDGTWYLSECLLSGLVKKVNIKGTSSHYRVGTTFKAFNASGQRFIMKLGGYADFSSPADDTNFTPGTNDNTVHTNAYKSVWCSNFILDGINFDTNNTTFVNADGTGECQNYAAVCFEWCVEGYVNIRTQGSCPGVFIASTWEVYFECITCYGCYTGLNGSAVYFGKCHTDVVYANVSAMTINNLFAESIRGKLVDCHNNANIEDLIINNVEFEPYHSGQQTVSHDGIDAYQIIESNIRNMDVVYYFNFSGHHVVIKSIVYTGNKDVTYENDTIARGVIQAATYGSHILVDKLLCTTDNPISIILGAANYAKLEVREIESETYLGSKQVFTISDEPASSFADIYDITNGKAPKACGDIIIRESNVVVDKDYVKLYGPGLLFNSGNISEVCRLRMSAYNTYKTAGLFDGIRVPLVYFFNTELTRKFRFNGTKLVFKYIGTNRWINGLSDANEKYHIKVTYYKDGSVAQTDRILLTYSATEIQSEEYSIWTGSYDYCTIYFNSAMCIESVTVKE